MASPTVDGLRPIPPVALAALVCKLAVMGELEAAFLRLGDQGSTLFDQTVQAVRDAMQSGLRVAFLISAVTMLASFLLLLTIPEIPGMLWFRKDTPVR